MATLDEAEAHRILDREIASLQEQHNITTHISGGTLATLSVGDKIQLLLDMQLVIAKEECEAQTPPRS